MSHGQWAPGTFWSGFWLFIRWAAVFAALRFAYMEWATHFLK